MKTILLFTFFIFTWIAQASKACLISNTQGRIQAVLSFEICEQESAPIFSNYRMSDYPFLLVDLEKAPNLITVVQKGKVIGTFLVQTPLVITNGLYEYQIPNDEHYNQNPQLNDPLRNIGISEAMIWNIGLNMPFAGTPLESWPEMSFHLALMTHEGFHFFGQNLKKTDVIWPAGNTYLGISQQSRDMMQALCFGQNDQIKSLVSSERQAILDSFIAIKNKDLKLSLEKAKEFISNRKARYSLLLGVQIFDPVLQPRSCEQVENVASLVEGIPEFIGIGTLLNLEIITPGQSILYFPSVDKANYYRFPLFQALLISRSMKISVTEALQHPENGIEAVLEKWISQANP